ncbi:glycoside hydrolase family 2 TIM barrel-domain containing protein [Arcanobacterium hippocoleae]
MDAAIYLNGTQLANHPYGYTPFSVDVTESVKFGQDNVLAVRVNHQLPSSRWYSGSGIYRDVDLVITDPVHVAHNGVKVTAKNIENYKGTGTLNLEVATVLENESAAAKSVTVKHTIKAKADGAVLGTVSASQELQPGAKATQKQDLAANSPKLWNLDNPQLYVVTTEVSAGDKVLDTVDTVTGFRQTKFDPNTGFELNGKKLKLKGVSMHHDQGALGAKAYRRAIERQIDILQEMGANTIRVTHNPASRDLVELANEKGMLLIEEIFDGLQYPKNGNRNDYSRFFAQTVPAGTKLENVSAGSTWAQFDLETTLKRDFNAPSVIMWSLGNEIGEGTQTHTDMSNYVQQQASLIQWAQAVDQTRPVTRGDNQLKGGSASAKSLMNSLVTAGGTAGLNYVGGDKYDSLHREYPKWPIYGSETASSVNSRGFYLRTSDNQQTSDKKLTSYDASKVNWGAEASSAWYDVIKRDFVAGEMVWTGFDYIGEPTHWNGTSPGAKGAWPSPKNSYFGIIDTAGFPKDSYYFYQSQWNDKAHTLHILPAWNSDVVKKNGSEQKVPVVVYSDARKVELWFTPKNGEKKKLGEKTFAEKTTTAGYKYQIYEGQDKNTAEHKNLYLTWEVPYQDGTLEAIGYDSAGKKIEKALGRSRVQTAGAAKKFDVQVDRKEIKADNEDLAYLDVTITDENGVPVPNAENVVSFTANGRCSIVGTDNGEQADHTSYLSPKRKAFAGKVLGIVKAATISGPCEITISADGLETKTVTVTAVKAGTQTQNAVSYYHFPRNYYVQVGQQPKLPAKIDAVMQDGTAKQADVTWEKATPEQISADGSFTLAGTTSLGDKISVNVTMLNTIGAVLNYSAVTAIGQAPALPASRPAVMPDGKVLNTNFPVKWNSPAESAYAKAGTVKIDGTANVFGKELKVSAAIRVVAENVSVGKNLAPAASTLTQDIPENQQSDTLAAIKDGKTAVPAINEGTNPNVWTNYKAAQAGDNKAEIVFGYDTQQEFSEFGIYFYKDNWSARYPDAGTTKFFVSESANGPWTAVETAETMGAEKTNVKPYTYKLVKPVTATYVKIEVTNKAENLDKRKPCTGISEVLLKGTERSGVTANTAAKLASLQVNGAELPESTLSSWKYMTPAEKIAALDYTAKDNAAVTLLPEYAGVVRLIVEAEDHKARNTFQIFLGQDQPLADDDASRDVKPADTRIEVGSQANTSGDDSKDAAIDGNPSTKWHTPWGAANPINGDSAKFAEKGWAVLILKEPADIEALRYLPRPAGNNNGTITAYDVFVSSTDNPTGAALPDGVKLPADDQYTKAASGTWSDNAEWKIAQFDKVYAARYVKLVPKATVSDTKPNMFVSAAEIRLRTAKPVIDLNNPELGYKIEISPAELTVAQVDADHPARPEKVTVTGKDGKQLTAGVNYRVTYTGDTQEGTAMVTVTGINTHKGTLTAEYSIKVQHPDVPGTPETPGTPDTPHNPDLPGTPDVPGTPGNPDTPELQPAEPNSPELNPKAQDSRKAANNLAKTGAGVLGLIGIATVLCGAGAVISRRREE